MARRGLRVAAIILSCLALAAILSQVWPAYRWVFGGADASNYINNGVRYADPTEPAFSFYPDKWELTAQDLERLEPVLLDAGGRMSKFSEVTDDGTVLIPQRNLYARILQTAYEVEPDRLPWLVNTVLWAALAVVMLLLARDLTRSWPGAAVAGGLTLMLPAYILAARFTNTEALATLLAVLCAWLTVRTRGESALPGLFLVGAWLTRPEFLVPLAIWLAWAVVRQKRGALVVVVATIAASYLIPFGLPRGHLVQTGRDIYAAVPQIEAWMLLPAYGLGVLVRTALSAQLDTASAWLAQLGRRPAVHRAVWASVAAGAVLAEVVRQGLDTGERLGPMIGQRHSTLGLVVYSVGWPLAVAGAIGLIGLGYRLAGRAPLILGAIALPHAWVLVRMHSSPPARWSWTRRFDEAFYPVLLIGVALLVAWLVERTRARVGPGMAATGLTALVVVAFLGASTVIPMRDDMPKFELGYSDVAAFDDAVAELPEDTFVFMANEFGGGKAQIPMRTYHGRWSYVVYEPSAFDLVARHLDDEGVRSFYVEQRLLDLLDDAGLACQVDSGSDPVAVPVRFGGNTAEDLVELVPVNGCEPTPASRPEAAGAS